MRFDTIDGIANLLNSQVDIITTPITNIIKATRILCKSLSIREILARNRIRIEIIVHVDSLDIIASNEVSHYLAQEITSFLQTWFKIPLGAIFNEPLGMLVEDMSRSNILNLATTTRYAIRIDPYVYINTALVSLCTHKFQRIISSRLTLLASKPSTPRF